MTLKRGDRGNTVGLYQQAILNWSLLQNVDLQIDGGFIVDKVFGADTEKAVRVYQAAAELPDRFTPGELDGVTCANLTRYVPLSTAPAGDHEHPHTHPIDATTGDPT